MKFTIVQLNNGLWTVRLQGDIQWCNGGFKCFIMDKYENVDIIGSNESYSLLNEMCIQRNMKTMSVNLDRMDFSDLFMLSSSSVNEHKSDRDRAGTEKAVTVNTHDSDNFEVLSVASNKELPTNVGENCIDITHLFSEKDINTIVNGHNSTSGYKTDISDAAREQLSLQTR